LVLTLAIQITLFLLFSPSSRQRPRRVRATVQTSVTSTLTSMFMKSSWAPM